MDKILRIDMGAKGGPAYIEEPMGDYKGLAGRALTSAIIAREVPPRCHPLGKENKLVMAPGLLSGSAADMSGRISFGFKSPLTGGIKESNAGGSVSRILARLGYAAIILEGKPGDDSTYKITISKSGLRIEVDNNLKMLGNYELVGKAVENLHRNMACVSIGPVGEMKMSVASIACTDIELDPTRHAGRGGGGAVMGSKGVKIIILDGTGTRSIVAQDKDRFANAAQAFATSLKEHPVTGTNFPRYGTSVMVEIVNEAGAFPTRYFSEGRFEGADRIDAFSLSELELKRGGTPTHGCHVGCIVRCSGVFNDESGEYITKQPEYETLWAHGANCGIDNLDAIAQLDMLDDDYGIDTIEMGNAVAVAMAAGLADFGDADRAIELVEEVGKGTPMGRILGAGTAIAAKILGVENAPVVKGQALPAYDPRVMQGVGVTYATSPMGADHTAGFAFGSAVGPGGKIEQKTLDELVALSKEMQTRITALDATGLCLFTNSPIFSQEDTFKQMLDLINSLYGWKLTREDFMQMGRNTLREEREFNKAAGFNHLDDRLPEFFSKIPLSPHNVTFQISDQTLDDLFKE